jgi:hypothetical protein
VLPRGIITLTNQSAYHPRKVHNDGRFDIKGVAHNLPKELLYYPSHAHTLDNLELSLFQTNEQPVLQATLRHTRASIGSNNLIARRAHPFTRH